MNAEDQRLGRYKNVNWAEVTPLDAAVIESMRHCESVFLDMIERYARHGDVSYRERMRQYMDHLRYWNHVLTTQKIDLLLMNTLPHQCYDWVLYHLCKLHGVPVLYLERCYIVDAFYVVDTVEDSATELRDAVQAVQARFADPAATIELSPTYEDVFTANTQQSADPWYMYSRSEQLARKSFVHKWTGTVVNLLWRKPKTILRAIVSPSTWARKMRQHRTSLYWDAHAVTPDLSQPYIYVPLHFQPEATTCPMAGMFNDQERLVQLLAACVPAGVRLYVKEHPAQGETARSVEFYEALRSIPNVTLVARNTSTFALTDGAAALATCTGTAGFEALFRGKPVLMFGDRFQKHAPGVYRVHTLEECTQAMKEIFEEKHVPTHRDCRVFLRALQESGTPYVGGHTSPHEPKTKEEKAAIMGAYMAKRIRSALAH